MLLSLNDIWFFRHIVVIVTAKNDYSLCFSIGWPKKVDRCTTLQRYIAKLLFEERYEKFNLFFFMIFFSMKVYATKIPLIQVIVSQFAPYEYVDDKGKETGFSLEVFQAIAAEVGAEIEVAFYPWSRGMKILAKNPNAVIFTATRNETREDNFKWVGPIASRSVNIYKLKKSRFKMDISSLSNEEALSNILSKQYVIGATIGDASEINLKSQGYDIFSVPNSDQSIKMLLKNRLELIISLELSLAYRLKKLGYKFSKVEQVAVFNDKYSYYFMFNKRISSDVVYQFQKALGKIKYNGVYDKLKEKYLN